MLIQSSKFAGLAILLGAALVLVEAGAGQGPSLPGQIQLPDAGPGQPIPLDPPQVPKGVEVQARGPVHEAFADTSKLQRHLGWQPHTSLDKGLTLQTAWQRQLMQRQAA
jgi:nucleoside-diphosphate-sugar epimerase